MNQQFKNTKIGEIPMDWEVVKLGDVFSFKNGLNKEKEFFGYGIPIVNYMDVFKNVGLTVDKIKGKVDVNDSELERYRVKKGDVFFTRTSETIKQIGYTACMLEDIDKAVFSGFILRARPKNDKLTLHYKKYCFSSYNTRKEIIRKSSYTTRALTNGTVLSEVIIPLPPLPEQKKIAEILTIWDNAINKTTALIKAKEVLKKGLMQGLLLGKVQVNKEQKEVFKKTKLGEIPKHWKLEKAGDIFKSISIKNNENEELLAATQAKGIIPKRLLETNYTMPSGSTNGYKLVQDGNFVISLRSFQGGIEYSEYQGIISPAYTILTNKIPIDKTFFRYFFKSTEFIGRLSVAVIGIRDGKQISFQDFSAMTFRFPPLEEQAKIANILETADKEIGLLKKELAKIEEQKRGLMQVLLTGKVRVRGVK